VPSATTAFGDSRWVRRRLGSAGAPRDALLERLLARLPDGADDVRLGLTGAELESVLPERDAFELATTARGDVERLRRIVWWGSALADLPDGADGARAEGGRFNLAFALFDSVVDDAPRRVPVLAHALAPDRLRHRLAGGAPLVPGAPELEPLVQLFDTALAGSGRRLRAQPRRLDELGDLLEAMLRSELGMTEDPFAAKTLPVVFLGALADGSAATARLFRALAEFLWLWDDWLDVAADLCRLRPNAFLGRGGSSVCLRGATRLVAGSRAHPSVADRLDRAFVSTLDAALGAGGDTYARTVAFHRELLA
jgi:hypothetical protein